MSKLEAILFDMDGTLMDSEPLWLKADLAMIAAHGGFMSEEEHDLYIGMGAVTFLPMIKEKYGIEASYEELREFQERTYLEIARSEICLFPQMITLAQWAIENHIPVGIASGSTNDIIDEMCSITGIRELFPVRVSAQEVEEGKPEPHVFLEAASRLQARPEACLVVEDSPVGVEAAYRAGMRTIAVPPPMVRDPKDFLNRADLLFEGGMTAFRSEDAISWISREYNL
jgi:HAD superfamily hydrolase (TIGR01509 family)